MPESAIIHFSRLLRYLFYKAKYPQFADFVDQGLGIEARAARNAQAWKPHLDCCRKFVIESAKNQKIEQPEIDSICILGAGRLLDIPVYELSYLFRKIHLVDADPACLAVWKKSKVNPDCLLTWEITDITARLKTWTKALESHIRKYHPDTKDSKNPDLLSDFIRKLSTNYQKNKWKPPEYDLVVSINILSQLGIYWQNRARKVLSRYGLAGSNIHSASLTNEQDLENALQETSALLESEHLDMISSSGFKSAIMIYDDEFYYYSANHSHWQTEKALSISPDQKFANSRLKGRNCWLWHLVPQGSETEEYGEIHRVQARLYIKR